MIKYCTWFLLIILCFSCEDSLETEESPTLVGSWELVEVCFSIGTGGCEEKIPDYTESIEFTNTGRIEIVRDNSICEGTYIFDGKEMLDLEADNSNCNFDKTSYRVSVLTSDGLTLHPPCREACSQHYRRID